MPYLPFADMVLCHICPFVFRFLKDNPGIRNRHNHSNILLFRVQRHAASAPYAVKSIA